MRQTPRRRAGRAASAAIVALAVFAGPALAQQPGAGPLASPALPPSGRLTVVERSDLQKHENGKYVGLENREVRGILEWTSVPGGVSAGAAAAASPPPASPPTSSSGTPAPSPDAARIEGTFYVIGELNRGGAPVASKVDAAFPSAWTVGADGVSEVDAASPYPILRGFPVIPARAPAVGDTWEAPGARMVEPFRDGTFTRVKILSSYRYSGDRVIDGKTYRIINAKYALTYRKPIGPVSDERVLSISGTHTVSIQLSASGGELSFMSDVLEETYQLADSKSLTYRGFILTWFNASVPLDKAKTADQVASALRKAGVADVAVEQKSEGVSITINAIHFVADQSLVLPEESPRLEAVAAALKQIPTRSFLVIGHTAAIGTVESQMDLSVQRAKAIVDFMVSRGMDSRRFLYEGKGGTQPVAPNDTEENMAKNRRVQIIVLED